MCIYVKYSYLLKEFCFYKSLYFSQKDDNAVTLGVDKINTILESFMGINDNELGILNSINLKE